MIDEHTEEEGLKYLERIEEELEEIKDRTPAPRRAFLFGLLQGAGALIGGVAALTLLGWLLSFFGVVPGFADISQYIQTSVDNFRR